MSDDLPNLRKIVASPQINPLLEPATVTVKRRYVSSGRGQDLLDPSTGEVHGMSIIRVLEERDDTGFVKVFAEGVKAAFGLTKTAFRVFNVVLNAYQREKMTGGYADSVRLYWFGAGLDGEAMDMSEKTFQRGLKELIAKRFLYPRTSELYWVNPSLFFKGDRVAFVKEYRRRAANEADVTTIREECPKLAQMDIEEITGQPVQPRGVLHSERNTDG